MTQYQYGPALTESGRLVPRTVAMHDSARSLLSVTPGAWRRAYRFSLTNATVFLALSWTLMFIDSTSLSLTLSPPALYSAGALISFVLLIRSGGAFAALPWFILGTGTYFGLGVFLGGLAPDPRSIHYVSESVLVNDLLRINTLNSSSIALVLVAAAPLAYTPRTGTETHAVRRLEIDKLLLRLFPTMAVLAFVSLSLQFLFFPVATNLIVRALLSSMYLTIPFFILTLGMVWNKLDLNWAVIGLFVFLSVMALSLLTMSKFSVMSNAAALAVGTWVYRRSVWSIGGALLMMGVIYAYTGGLANEGRLHSDYDAITNSPVTRLRILADTVIGNSGEDRASQSGSVQDVPVPATLIRFSVADIQSYLIDQYDSQKPGTSLDDFWVAAIPRVLWPDKPVVTRFGSQLHELFWDSPHATSALAPTYTGEAYWNYGPLGVVVVSILIGLEVGWLTQRWHIAADGRDLAFLVIAFPTALWATFVEAWIAANYVGGFITIVLLWYIARFLLLRLFVGALRGPGARLRRVAN